MSHQTGQMSQRSQVSGIAFLRCSSDVFVFVIVFFLVWSCLLITLINCLKGHKSLGSLCCCVFEKVAHSVREWVSKSVSDNVTDWAVGWTAKKGLKNKHWLNESARRGWLDPFCEQIVALISYHRSSSSLTHLFHSTPFVWTGEKAGYAQSMKCHGLTYVELQDQ